MSRCATAVSRPWLLIVLLACAAGCDTAGKQPQLAALPPGTPVAPPPPRGSDGNLIAPENASPVNDASAPSTKDASPELPPPTPENGNQPSESSTPAEIEQPVAGNGNADDAVVDQPKPAANEPPPPKEPHPFPNRDKAPEFSKDL